MLKNHLFPGDSIGSEPRIVLSGGDRLLIEKHQGVIIYTEEKLSVRIGGGYVNITGHSLEISEYGNLDMVVSGKIKSLEFVNV